MTLIYDGPFMVAYEGAYGTSLREGRLCRRIIAGEFSLDFIVEIAESTLPYRNIANLLDNLISRQEWTPKNMNLKSICEKIIKACEIAQDTDKVPMTGGSLSLNKTKEIDLAGREVKRYPHTYDAILYPHLVKSYAACDTPERRKEWKRRTERDGSVPIMNFRVDRAEKPRAQLKSHHKFEPAGPSNV